VLRVSFVTPACFDVPVYRCEGDYQMNIELTPVVRLLSGYSNPVDAIFQSGGNLVRGVPTEEFETNREEFCRGAEILSSRLDHRSDPLGVSERRGYKRRRTFPEHDPRVYFFWPRLQKGRFTVGPDASCRIRSARRFRRFALPRGSSRIGASAA
jgi:hypothetical protein